MSMLEGNSHFLEAHYLLLLIAGYYFCLSAIYR